MENNTLDGYDLNDDDNVNGNPKWDGDGNDDYNDGGNDSHDGDDYDRNPKLEVGNDDGNDYHGDDDDDDDYGNSKLDGSRWGKWQQLNDDSGSFASRR